MLWAAQYQTIDSTAGTGYELKVMSAVVVGGVAIFGGSGSAVGAAIGALLLSTISSALNVLGISPFWDQAIAGFLLLVAITLDRVDLGAPARRAAAKEPRRWNLSAPPPPRRPRPGRTRPDARAGQPAPAARGSVRWETGLVVVVVAIVVFGASTSRSS